MQSDHEDCNAHHLSFSTPALPFTFFLLLIFFPTQAFIFPMMIFNFMHIWFNLYKHIVSLFTPNSQITSITSMKYALPSLVQLIFPHHNPVLKRGADPWQPLPSDQA